MFTRIAVPFLVMAFSTPALAEGACPIERANYVSVDDPKFTAGFAIKPPGGQFVSDLAFYVHSGATSRTFWFLFDAGSARYMTLISTQDVTAKDWRPPDPDGPKNHPYPSFEMHYLQSDSGLHFRYNAPRYGQAAPAYILLPDLAERMWYAIEPREGAPVGVFKLSNCAH